MRCDYCSEDATHKGTADNIETVTCNEHSDRLEDTEVLPERGITYPASDNDGLIFGLY